MAHQTLESAATREQKAKPYETLRYIESHKPLTNAHVTFFHALRKSIDDILSSSKAWILSKISPKLLQIIDHNYKYSSASLNAAPPEMLLYLSQWSTTTSLIAVCMGTNWISLPSAQQCALDIVQWRVCSKIDHIRPSDVSAALATQSVYSTGTVDTHGHPICHFRVLASPPDDAWTMVRAAVFAMEKSMKVAHKKGVYQMVWMVDLEHLSYSTLPPLEILKEVMTLLTYFYPERLRRAYLLFTPWIFDVVLNNMIVPNLPERTQTKLVTPGWTASAEYETFKNEINRDQLPKRCGGSVEMEYSYEWEVEEFEKARRYEALQAEMAGKGVESVEVEVKEEKKAEEEDGDDEEEETTCVVCMDGARDHVLIPCGHICVCAECKASYDGGDAECPMCRTKVEMVVRTYQ